MSHKKSSDTVCCRIVGCGSWSMVSPSKWRTILQRHERLYQGQSYWLWMGGVDSLCGTDAWTSWWIYQCADAGLWVLCILLPVLFHVQQISGQLYSLHYVQSVLGLWTASDMIPTVEDRFTGDALVAELKSSRTYLGSTFTVAAGSGRAPTNDTFDCSLGYRS